MNVQVEVTWQTLQTITHSIILHTQVLDKYIHFELIYTTGYILPVIPIKHLVNQDGGPTTPKNWKMTQNLQNQTYMFYYVHMLY